MGTDSQIATIDQSIILFDGVCNLCNGAVQFIIKRDPEGYFKFASLQSGKAADILLRFNLDPTGMESIILVEKGRIYHKSNAVLLISKKLSGLWPLFSLFIIIPVSLRDLIYDWIAKNRYKWFGRKNECMVPTIELKSRFVGV